MLLFGSGMEIKMTIEILSLIVQFLMVLIFFFTVIITMYEIRENNREKIRLISYFTVASSNIDEQFKIGIGITNLGKNLIYITSYGLIFKQRHCESAFDFCHQNILINPGEKIELNNEDMLALFSLDEGEWLFEYEVYIFVDTSRGKRILQDTHNTYLDIAKSLKMRENQTCSDNGKC